MTIAAATSPPEPIEEVFVGPGEMAHLMRAHDWASTPLGPPQQWPNALKVALRLLLTSRFQMWLGWGPEVHFFYNDAYRPTLGIKHPCALARPTRELWAEIWDDVKGRIETVYQRGEATWDKALLLILHRSGYPEETYHTFSYSPLYGDDGRVEGLFCAVSEETGRVINERRLAALRELAAGLATAETPPAVFAAACTALHNASRDWPFALLYQLDEPGRATLRCAAGIDPGHALAPRTLAAHAGLPWDLDQLATAGGPFVVDLPADAPMPRGPWGTTPRQAVVVPVATNAAGPAALLVAALNPYLGRRDDMLGFAGLFAGQVGASLGNAFAYERHLAERDRLRALFRGAPGFLVVLGGPTHVVELTNSSYEELIGFRDIEGKPLAQALPEVVGQGFLTLLDQVYASGERHVGRNVMVRLASRESPELRTRYVDFVYQPVRDARGHVSGIFVEGSDVTDKVEAEQALRALNHNLEARVEERTRALEQALEKLREESRQREQAQDALRQSQKMEAVGQLTGGIAHDFNNLLQGITGALDVMTLQLQRGRTQGLETMITRAMGSARRAAGLTQRLLAFSRRQALDPRPLNVNNLLTPMEELLRRTMGENIRIELVLAAGLWPTLCDPNQLESAILNLCINARDAMPGGGLLTIESANTHLDDHYAALHDVQSGQYVCVSVTDTGAGMPPDVLAKAFDPFFTTKPIGQGTGLGLSMVYGFVRQSHGHVRLYSEVDRGTTARIYLPRHWGEADAPEPLPPISDEHRATTGEVLLVVEDEPIVRATIVDVLHGLGYLTLEAADGATALAILQSDARIDLLVTDVGLPVLNGRQLYDAALARRPGLKVLFMTGYAENAAFGSGMLGPGMELITKPFPMERLATKVGAMLERQAR